MFMFSEFPSGDPRGTHKELYDTLGVDCDAKPSAIKKAFHRKSIQHHPDKGGDNTLFQKISHAYSILNDTFKRRVYDEYGEKGLESEMIQSVVRRKMRKQLEPVKINIQVKLEKCLKPQVKHVTFRRILVSDGVMTTENVEEIIHLPAGLAHNQIVRIEGKGNFIENSKTDLICVVELEPHLLFDVQGFELLLERNISFVAALLGCVYTIPTLDEESLPVYVPPLSVFKDSVRTIENKGLPLRDTGMRGSLHVKFNIDYASMQHVTISKELGILLRDELESSDAEIVGGSAPQDVFDKALRTKMYDSDAVNKRMELSQNVYQEPKPDDPVAHIIRDLGGLPPGSFTGGFPFPGMRTVEVGEQCTTQ